jgi:hypothetical protein
MVADSMESDPSVFGMVIGGESLLVDDDLMVEPAEGDEILGVCGSALAPGDLVVDLEAMVAVAAVGSAGVAVSFQDGPA